MRWLTNPWAWMLPPTVVQAAVLLFSSKVWDPHLATALRGPNRMQSESTGILIALFLLPALLALTGTGLFRDLVQAHRSLGMEPVSDAQAGCAVGLTRFALVATAWLVAWRALAVA